jgi:phosphoadenosine phosphosulfate reductase
MRNTEELTATQAALEDATPQAILRWATGHFDGRLALVTSFQITGVATLHMLHAIAPQLPVLTLDTGLLFDETYDLIAEIRRRCNPNLHILRPALSVDEQAAAYGDKLWQHDPDSCCHLRKTLPLQHALHDYDAWFTGLRRDQSPARANTPTVAWSERYQAYKIAPFANWTHDMVWDYVHTHDLPYNTLYDDGYSSIGCWPCTKRSRNVDDLRGGRWLGQDKTECGIHVEDTSGRDSV